MVLMHAAAGSPEPARLPCQYLYEISDHEGTYKTKPTYSLPGNAFPSHA